MAGKGVMDAMDWFCGDNASTGLDNFTWDLEHTLHNACFVDLAYALPHLLFLILASLVLLVLACCTAAGRSRHHYLVPYPGHNFRWVVNLAFFTLTLFEVLEGVLSTLTDPDGPGPPHLYLPAVLAFLATLLAMVYYTEMEVWNRSRMAWLLFLYWGLALAAEIVRLLNLRSNPLVDFTILRLDLNLLSIVIYSVFVLLEFSVIVKKCFTGVEELPDDLKKENMRYMQGYCSLLSSSLFCWLNWIFKKGYRRALEMSDLGSLSEVHSAKYLRQVFTKALDKELAIAKAKKKTLSLYSVYARAFGLRILMGGFVKIIGDISSFVPPLALSGIINYVTNLHYADPDTYHQVLITATPETMYISVTDFMRNGFVLIIIMFWVTIIKLLSQQGHYHIVITESVHIRTALQAAIYDKALRLSSYTMSGGSMTMGQITNHMSVDTTNILSSTQWIHYIWSIPFLVIGYMLILYFELGLAALIGCLVFCFTIPAQVIIARQTAKFQKIIMEKSDDRLKKTNELLQGIKLIKLYGWEDMFYTAISKVRSLEIMAMMKAMGWRIVLMTITNASPLMVTLVSYSLYTKLTGKALTSAVAFAALTVFNQMTIPLYLMPNVFVMHINAVVSTRRLRAFFDAPEIERQQDSASKGSDSRPVQGNINSEVSVRNGRRRAAEDRQRLISSDDFDDSYDRHEFAPSPEPSFLPDDVAIRMRGNFTWDKTATTPTIRDIDLDIPSGKLTIIVGQVGSGKSSLLSAILGEMTTVSGGVEFNDKSNSVCYGAQKAWLLNTSFKENILFGNKMDYERYKRVVAACSLQPDIDILPAGDQTEIGEKGINLSGGQKQRVSVARAMYSYNDIVVLDDPLSALDMHVGGHLFREGIGGFLMKKSKRTVVLVTHQLQYAEKADKIVYMQDGVIRHQGTLEDIREENPELVANWAALAKEITEGDSETEAENVQEERAKLVRQISSHKTDKVERADSSAGRLVEKEERAEGSVNWRIYRSYIKSLGFGVFFLQLFLILAQNGFGIATNYWLSVWSEDGNNATIRNTTHDPESLGYYLVGYAGLSVGSITSGALAFIVIYMGSLFAAKKLHNSMLSTIMSAPLRFFDTTPVGRILNRFSSDTSTIDQRIGGTLSAFLRFSLSCLSAVLVDAVVSWYFIIALIPVMVLYLLLMKVFITTSRELQRLDSINKSPVYAHFSESLGGLSTIRAYRQEKRFQHMIIKKIENSNLTFLYLNTSNRWLASRLDLIGAFIVLGAALSTTIAALTTGTLPSLVGLAITYALSISSQLNWVIRMGADLEMQMNAMERVEYYKATETENYDGLLEPSDNWPNRGEIVFRDVSARYASDLEPVLHSVSVQFKAGEKIGICGRTGSGKSSLTLTLFRIIQTFRGSITIDGLDISHLPLVQVRRRIAIIPQDPVLFNGTIRFNLDARGEHEDEALWRALEIAQLKDVVCGLDLKLDAIVTEGGENFSVGQRQLFCLARAFLRKTQILVMDEATASIDLETDAILQDVVATAFRERTVLTIAHRVQTILDADRILVLNEGRIAEYDTPTNLLEQEDSIFASLVKAGT